MKLLSHRQILFKVCFGIILLIPIAISLYIRFHQSNKPKVAVITNCAVDFWVIGGKGVDAGGKAFNVDAEFRMPALMTAAEQNRIIEDLVAKGVQGIATSIVDSANQTAVLNRIIPDKIGRASCRERV
jgi:ABC-type sugar transport system substrate-binding protein